MKSIFKLLRPKQWTKNGLVFAALIFAGAIFREGYFLRTLVGFSVFCLISSSVYVLNDIVDRGKDRLHPKKKDRPVASGAISVPIAVCLLVVLLLVTLVVAYVLNVYFFLVILAYFLINVAYSLALKKIAILDIMCIASGFVLRALSGSFLIDVGISPWLIVCTLLLALFLAIHKRKGEIARMEGEEIGRAHV